MMTMKLVFWFSVAWIGYAYVGYTLLLALAARFRRRPVAAADVKPFVSVIVTVHNAAPHLGRKLDNLLAQDYPAERTEILVADDASDDGTDRLVMGKYASRGVRLVRLAERGGKERSQRETLSVARGEVLIFTDVATALDSDGLSRIVRSFADPGVGGVSSADRLLGEDGDSPGESAYVRYEMKLRQLESEVGSLVGMSGSFFAVRREVCGDFSDRLQSDFRTALVAVRLGYRCVLDRNAIGYYKDVASSGSEFQRKVRTVVRGLTVLFAELGMLNPLRYGLFSWQLFSHKVVRWTVPFAMLLAVLSSAWLSMASGLFALFLILQLMAYGYAAAALRLPRLAASMLGRAVAYLVHANAAILVAWLRFVRGERIVMWTPSRR